MIQSISAHANVAAAQYLQTDAQTKPSPAASSSTSAIEDKVTLSAAARQASIQASGDIDRDGDSH